MKNLRLDIRILKIPLKQLGYASITDFIADIPQEIFSEYLNQSTGTTILGNCLTFTHAGEVSVHNLNFN